MLANQELSLQSIVNHVYFAGSIRSFCTAIGLTFFRNNQDYIDRAIKNSVIDFKQNVSTEDKILTLSTCADNNKDRVVVHAKKQQLK